MLMVVVVMVSSLHIHLLGPENETEDKYHLGHYHSQGVEGRVPIWKQDTKLDKVNLGEVGSLFSSLFEYPKNIRF